MGHHHHDHSKDMPSHRLGWAFLLNFVFTIIEFIGGLLTNSTAILADAVHDLGDSLSLGLAWLLNKVGNKQANTQFTYGYKRLNLVGAFINAVVLIAGSVWILVTAIPRLWQPQMPMADGMIMLAVLGIAVNGFAAYKLAQGKTLNERVINWHLLEDVMGWVAVLIVGIVLLFVDAPILDPLLSIAFTLFILLNVARNLWETLRLFVQASPDKQTYQAVAESLQSLPHVCSVHHLHFWSLDGESHVLTAHLVLQHHLSPSESGALKQEIDKTLHQYALSHTTIELEYPDESCRDEP
ncbi:Cadmium, cobalt and zinc/H(+)-K(+) antiporter [Pseudidiomarina piscicola]|uniref:Cadmium, cobalt and zinc/H(+)-K(+) antiporter n=1 Tax=Pseudidiomarina piscicola TaxID=2614830 RepID=A0A6S6WQ83_9GAMM|nr:cation diffusion facilitator family transporter [Pseudidiomarina piscicola]CAB0151456.1 Cadmium, cobalt and zinc/H(+)-K(+) antiporter [Pseudidiomarina piscicola]VZT40935.1 Cadmium, cobalt and zinc/H(+)-K(+) antiporter [Pseudomonas aeruginosa]